MDTILIKGWLVLKLEYKKWTVFYFWRVFRKKNVFQNQTPERFPKDIPYKKKTPGRISRRTPGGILGGF